MGKVSGKGTTGRGGTLKKVSKPIGKTLQIRKPRKLGFFRKYRSVVKKIPLWSLKAVGLGNLLEGQKFRLRRANMISNRFDYIELPGFGKKIILIGETHTPNFTNSLRPEIPVMEPVTLIDKILEGSAGPVDVFLEIMYVSRDLDYRTDLPDSPLRNVFYKYEDKLLVDKPFGEDHRFHYADVRSQMFREFCSSYASDPAKCGLALSIFLTYASSYGRDLQTIKRYLWDETSGRWIIDIEEFVGYLKFILSPENYVEKTLLGKQLSKIQNPDLVQRFTYMLDRELKPIPEQEFETLRKFLVQTEEPSGVVENFYLRTAAPTLFWTVVRAMDFYFLARMFKNNDFRRIIFMGGTTHVASISELLVKYFEASPKTVFTHPGDFHVVHLDEILPLITDSFMA